MATGSGVLDARPAIGISAMLANTILLPIMGVAVKMLTADGYSALDMLSWRALLVIGVLTPVLLLPRYLKEVLTADIRAHLLHATFTVSSMFCFYYALQTLPIVTVTTINFTTPAFTLILARLLFSEQVSISGVLAIVVGFLGAVLVLRPDPADLDAAGLVVLLGSALAAAANLTIRRMPARSSNFAAIFYLSLAAAVIYSILGASTMPMPEADEWPWVLTLAIVALGVHSCVIIAFRFASTVLVGALDYLRIVTAFLFGLFFFNEIPNLLDLAGIVLIVVSGAVVLASSAPKRKSVAPV